MNIWEFKSSHVTIVIMCRLKFFVRSNFSVWAPRKSVPFRFLFRIILNGRHFTYSDTFFIHRSKIKNPRIQPNHVMIITWSGSILIVVSCQLLHMIQNLWRWFRWNHLYLETLRLQSINNSIRSMLHKPKVWHVTHFSRSNNRNWSLEWGHR